MKAKIEMLDDDGNVTDVIEDVHVCTGDPQECESPLFCEECGHRATSERPVYGWKSSMDIYYPVCAEDLATDSYARLVPEA